jgi:ubiquinone/menaquinone biosynthesis C-methylase UbiE
MKEHFKNIGTLLSGFGGVWVIYCLRKSGLLKFMSRRKAFVSVMTVCRKTRHNERFVRTLLWAAHSFGLLDYREGRGFKLAPHMGSILGERNCKYYLGDVADLCVELSETYKLFPAGMTSRKKISFVKPKPAAVQSMAQITRRDFPVILEKVIQRSVHLKKRLESGGRILDMGTGQGEGAIFFAKAFPNCKITAVDFDKGMMRRAKSEVARRKLSPQITLMAKDARQVHFADKFDLIYMNLSLHEIGLRHKDMEVFLKKCRSLLGRDGVLLISEFPFFDDLRRHQNPVHRILFGFQLAEAVFGSGITSVQAFKLMLKKAGFARILEVRQPNPARVFLLARKH